MDRGLVVDWAAQKAVLDVALTHALSVSTGQNKATKDSRLLEGRKVILTEAYLNLPDLQMAMDLLLIEEYGAASIWRCAPAYLIPYAPSLFANKSHPAPGRRRSRPECMLIVDLGHGGSHVVPLVGDNVIWKAVRRHVVTQRIITNFLKELISFRQWDMMDEAWLINHVKENCCFVAARSGQRGESINVTCSKPSEWSYAGLLEMCEQTPKKRNPIVQEYVLPDYANSSKRSKYGFIRHGPGSQVVDADDLDTFVADLTSRAVGGILNSTKDVGEEEGDEADDDESDDEFNADGTRSDVDTEDDSRRPSKKSKSKDDVSKSTVKASRNERGEEGESEQILVLERERFQVPEIMFDPAIAGLNHMPLHEVILASIEACDADVRGPLWSNVVLVGGGARMRGLKRRLEGELRSLAPIEMPVHVYTPSDPSTAAIEGAQTLLSSAPGTGLAKVLEARLQPGKMYNYEAACRAFGSWSSAQK
jgi:actin-related protein 6